VWILCGGMENQGSGPKGLLSIPCYWDSLLVGAASGFAVGAHRYHRTRVLWAAVDWGVKMLCVASLGSFGLCRQKFHSEQRQVKEALQQMNEKRIAKAAPVWQEKEQ